MTDALNQIASQTLEWLTAASLQLAVFIALVAVAAWLLRRASPRLRYGLWLLVLVKALTPPWLGAAWSLGELGATPAREYLPPVASELLDAAQPAPPALPASEVVSAPAMSVQSITEPGATERLDRWTTVLATYDLDEPIDGARIETDTTVKVEGAASTKITTKWPTTVCLMDVEAPKIENAKLIYSAQVKADLDGAASLELWSHAGEAKYFSRNPTVAAFGKSDWKRLQVPFFYQAGQQPDRLTLNLIITGPGTVWVDDIKLLKEPLPTSVGAGQSAPAGKRIAAKPVAATTEKQTTPYPVVVETSPKRGATDVDPKTDEIRVTFDRPMSPGGYSWTGDAKSDAFPRIDEKREVRWEGDRTCVLPVKLQAGKFYRIGVNGKRAQNFKSTGGQPAAHTAIYFATEGANRSVTRKARAPEISELSPANGSEGVDPSLKKITVTFDSPMGGGMSWVRTSGRFPGTKDGRPKWSKDGRSCTLPVNLEPGVTYKLSLNGSHYTNFQSKWGVPLEPVVWTFTTASE